MRKALTGDCVRCKYQGTILVVCTLLDVRCLEKRRRAVHLLRTPFRITRPCISLKLVTTSDGRAQRPGDRYLVSSTAWVKSSCMVDPDCPGSLQKCVARF